MRRDDVKLMDTHLLEWRSRNRHVIPTIVSRMKCPNNIPLPLDNKGFRQKLLPLSEMSILNTEDKRGRTTKGKTVES